MSGSAHSARIGVVALEAAYGIPVLSANQVTMWAAARAAGVEMPLTTVRTATPQENP